MKSNLIMFILIFLAGLLLFSACKEDNPTAPDNNNNVVTDPNPPDYPALTNAWFRLDIIVTKQYDTYSTDDWMMLSPTFVRVGGFSNDVFYAESTYATFDGEQTEELTITIDTITGKMSDLEYSKIFDGPVSNYNMSITLSNINRTINDYNSVAYSDSGMATCTHINTVDISSQNTATPHSSYIMTGHECLEDSRVEVHLMTY